MTLIFIRCFFVLISAAVGYYAGTIVNQPVFGVQIGAGCGVVLIFLESQLRNVSVRGLSSMVFGLLLGLFMAKLLSDILLLLPLGTYVHSVARVSLTVGFSYLGAVMALRGKDEFNIIIPYVRFKRQDFGENMILLDTSVIIDGRIVDIYKTHFLSGRLVVPRFVLKELHALADSTDEIKRQRGRRGIDLLRQMQNDPKMDIHIHESDMTNGESVDALLIRLAKLIDASICTLDYNLARVASLQEIEVLNLNELVESVKSVVYPGEVIAVDLIKGGKEPNQAVGYMEDGTMIVVNDAKEMIGKKVDACVSSVLQTHSGKLIFAKLQR